jgi:hypothetical protein
MEDKDQIKKEIKFIKEEIADERSGENRKDFVQVYQYELAVKEHELKKIENDEK